jgi:hypothetical protein
MGIDAAMQSKPFRYDRLQLHFIYSFCLSNGREPLYSGEFEKILKQPEWTREIPRDRQGGITPFLQLTLMRAYKSVDFGTVNVNGRHVKLSGLFRLFGIGGTLTLSMDLEPGKSKKLTTTDAHELLKVLRMSHSDSVEPLICGKEKYSSLLDLFRTTLLRECEALAQGTGCHIRAYDRGENLVDHSMAQSPWLVTVFQVSDEEAKAFCSGIDANTIVSSEEKTQHILPYYHEIGPILFRSVSGENFPVEPTYRGREGGIKSSSNGLLSNMHLDARMFVCSSRRNVVCVAKSLEDEPASYFLPGILGINEGVRARWHALIMLNRSLDGILDRYGVTVDVGEQVPAGSTKTIESRRASEGELLREIVLLRRWIARVLDDPGIYTISGDALAALYDRGKEVFSLDELKRLLLEKADLVDRLHAYEQQLSWAIRN